MNPLDAGISILHVSDFHCTGNNTQNLRKGFLDEYLDGLIGLLKQATVPPSICVASGDFIDQGTIESFKLAKQVLDYLAKGLGIDFRNFILVPGNHDYERPFQKTGNFLEARNAYNEFARGYGPQWHHLHESARSANVQINSFDLKVLAIDSTWGNTECKAPRTWPSNEFGVNNTIEDGLLQEIKSHVSGPVLLVSHYPIQLFDALSATSETEYAESHLAVGLENLRRRVSRLTNKSNLGFQMPMVWFHGDVHKPDWSQDDVNCNIHYSVVGNLDDPKTTGKSQGVRKAARLLTIQTSQNCYELTCQDFEYREGRSDRQIGEWLALTAKEHAGQQRDSKSVVSSPKKTLRESDPLPDKNGATVEIKTATVLDEQLCEAIEDFVKTNQLLSLERHCGQLWDRLTHVMLGPMMTDTDLAGGAIVRFCEKIEEIVHGDSGVLLIGVDVWGACLAAEIGVRTGLTNLSLTLRESDDLSAKSQFLEECNLLNVESPKSVFFITDVAVTCDTIRRAYDIVKNVLKDCDRHFSALSLLSPKSVPYRADISFLRFFYTCCDSIPFVLVKQSDLPDRLALPPTR